MRSEPTPIAATQQRQDRRELAVAQRHVDRLRRGRGTGAEEKLDQRDLQTLLARRQGLLQAREHA